VLTATVVEKHSAHIAPGYTLISAFNSRLAYVHGHVCRLSPTTAKTSMPAAKMSQIWMHCSINSLKDKQLQVGTQARYMLRVGQNQMHIHRLLNIQYMTV
jgi:hypothetical protein